MVLTHEGHNTTSRRDPLEVFAPHFSIYAQGGKYFPLIQWPGAFFYSGSANKDK
jgi:hypothetical protein